MDVVVGRQPHVSVVDWTGSWRDERGPFRAYVANSSGDAEHMSRND